MFKIKVKCCHCGLSLNVQSCKHKCGKYSSVPSDLSSEKASTEIEEGTAKTNKPSHVQERLELEISILQGDLYGLHQRKKRTCYH